MNDKAGVRKLGMTVSIAIFWLLSQSVQAGVVPGKWEKVATLEPGTPIVVRLPGGEHIPGTFLEVGETEILMATDSSASRPIPKSSIIEITSRARTYRDGVLDGLGKGLIMGALAGSPFLIWGLAYPGASKEDALNIGSTIFLWSAAVGAGVGVAADAARQAHEVYYVAADN